MNIRTPKGRAVHELRSIQDFPEWEEHWDETYCGMAFWTSDLSTEDTVTCKACIAAKAKAEVIAKVWAERATYKRWLEEKDGGEA